VEDQARVWLDVYLGRQRIKMIRGLQCSSKQKAAGLPNEMANCLL